MTKKEITKIVMEGATGEYSHLIIYCDHWDYTYGYRYVKYSENINMIIDNIKAGGSPGMFSIDEVYNYNLNLNDQINERRAYHIEPLIEIKDIEDNREQKTNENNEKTNQDNQQKEQDNYISENLKKAIEYAIEMHEGQKRRNGSPYIKHPLSVAKNVLKYKKSKNLEILLISACLHDTLEDTEATYYDIIQQFGPQVASIVLELTTDQDMKNVLGKERYLAIKMKNMSSWALVIKLCDRLDNISDLSKCTEKTFKTKYINETIGILNYLFKNRKLSKTHLTIVEHIICLLFELCRDDVENKTKLADIFEICLTFKTNIENNNNTYKKLLEITNYLDKSNGDNICKKLIL